MEVVKKYRINHLFANLLPGLSTGEAGERVGLKKMIAEAGRITSPLAVWQPPDESPDVLPYLIGGHHRDMLRDELLAEGVEIPEPEIQFVKLPDENAVIAWMIAEQDARRNWTPMAKAKVILENKELIEDLKAQADGNLKLSKGWRFRNQRFSL